MEVEVLVSVGNPATNGGFVGVLVAYDQYSGLLAAVGLRRGDKMHEKLPSVLCQLTKGDMRRIRGLRADNQFRSAEIQKLCESNGWFIPFTVPYSHTGNGGVERANRTLQATGRALLHAGGGQENLFVYAILHAVRVVNAWPTQLNEQGCMERM